MKQLLVCSLLVLLATTGSMFAADLEADAPQPPSATTQTAASPAASDDTRSDASEVLSNTVIRMPIHDLATAGATASGVAQQGVEAGANCVSCSSHADCTAVCGGFGACLRDLGLSCGSFPTDKYCFC